MNSNIAKAKNNLSYYKRLIESGQTLTTKQQTRYEELMNIVKEYIKPVKTEEEKQKMRLDYIERNKENAKRRYHEKIKTNPEQYEKCREYAKNYYQTHKEELKKYYQEHKEEERARARSYYHEHKGEERARSKNYYHEHKEELKAKRELKKNEVLKNDEHSSAGSDAKQEMADE